MDAGAPTVTAFALDLSALGSGTTTMYAEDSDAMGMKFVAVGKSSFNQTLVLMGQQITDGQFTGTLQLYTPPDPCGHTVVQSQLPVIGTFDPTISNPPTPKPYQPGADTLFTLFDNAVIGAPSAAHKIGLSKLLELHNWQMP